MSFYMKKQFSTINADNNDSNANMSVNIKLKVGEYN